MYSLVSNNRFLSPSNFIILSKTTVRVGMLMPIANVSDGVVDYGNYEYQGELAPNLLKMVKNC